MALAFRSANQANDNAEVASLTVAAPAGIQDDDILLFFLELAAQTDTPSVSGFTELTTTTHDGGRTWVAWKRASSESGNYQATWTNNTRCCGIVYAISGADTTGTPMTVGTWATNSGTAPDPPSVDPGSSDDRLAVVVYGQEGKGNARFTPNASYTEPTNSDIGTTGGGAGTVHCGLGAAYRTYTGQTEDPGTATSGTNDGWAAQTIIFDPEPASGRIMSSLVDGGGLVAKGGLAGLGGGLAA